ncbi:MAG: replication-relaxation family protein, partial [Actinomycetota bacterium]
VAILNFLYDHRVLLTEHVRTLFFTSLRRAQDSLKQLRAAGLVASWFPPQERGKGRTPGHHMLTEKGVQVVAAVRDVARSELKWVSPESPADAPATYLAHRVGVNAFFCALIEASLLLDDHCLAIWTPERTVKTLDGWIRPDGFGRYLHPSGACDFYFEYDRGTESTAQLTDKLAGYMGVARDWTERGPEHFPNLLILCPDARRERAIAVAFKDAKARFSASRKLARLPFFVASEQMLADRGVLGRVWAPLPAIAERLSVVELSCQTGLDHNLSDCLGRYWRERRDDRWARLHPLARPPRFPPGRPPTDRRPRGRP